MKKLVSLAVALTFLFQGTASAGVIQGSSKSCKVGTTKVDSKYKYTCVQSGIWKKTSLPVKTPKPTKSPAPIAKVEPVQTPVTVETKTTTVEVPFSIDNLNVNAVYTKSRESVESAISKSSYELSGVNFYVGPTVDKSKFDAEKLSFIKASKLWSNIYKPAGDVHVVLYDYKSLDWAKSTVSSIHPNAALMSANSCFVFYCGNATSGKLFNGHWLLEQGVAGGNRNLSTSAHEYTHLAQASTDHQFWTNAPLWLVEGSAQFYGEAIGYTPVDSNKYIRLESHRGTADDFNRETGKNIKSLLQQNNVETVKGIMSIIEFPSPRYAPGNGPLAYLIGGYATEVLVAVYGHESYEKFVVSFGSSKDWQLNFKNSFGITKDEFYGKLTSYLVEVSKEL